MDQSESVVAVIGLGYIGLPTAVILANHGVRVIGVDTDERRVAAVNSGQLPFVEPDLAEHLATSLRTGMLSAQTNTPRASTYIVAVPTPFGEGHRADLSYVDAAMDSISSQLTGSEMILIESTSPPGTTERAVRQVRDNRPDLVVADETSSASGIQFAYCPERVLPGRIIAELIGNDRIVGGLTAVAAERAKRLYGTFCRGEVLTTDARTAEMTKLTENAFRDVNIALANELSNICQEVGVDIWELIRLANRHPRVEILEPGPGVGGHCIAVDPWFLVEAAPTEARLIRVAREVNDRQPSRVVSQVIQGLQDRRSARIAVLGLSYKRDVDDLRGSPAVQIVAALSDALPDAAIMVVEPHLVELPQALAERENVRLLPLNQALQDPHLVAVLVDHSAFAELVDHLGDAALVDARGLSRNW